MNSHSYNDLILGLNLKSTFLQHLKTLSYDVNLFSKITPIYGVPQFNVNYNLYFLDRTLLLLLLYWADLRLILPNDIINVLHTSYIYSLNFLLYNCYEYVREIFSFVCMISFIILNIFAFIVYCINYNLDYNVAINLLGLFVLILNYFYIEFYKIRYKNNLLLENRLVLERNNSLFITKKNLFVLIWWKLFDNCSVFRATIKETLNYKRNILLYTCIIIYYAYNLKFLFIATYFSQFLAHDLNFPWMHWIYDCISLIFCGIYVPLYCLLYMILYILFMFFIVTFKCAYVFAIPCMIIFFIFVLWSFLVRYNLYFVVSAYAIYMIGYIFDHTLITFPLMININGQLAMIIYICFFFYAALYLYNVIKLYGGYLLFRSTIDYSNTMGWNLNLLEKNSFYYFEKYVYYVYLLFSARLSANRFMHLWSNIKNIFINKNIFNMRIINRDQVFLESSHDLATFS